jgi:hypothetical protein
MKTPMPRPRVTRIGEPVLTPRALAAVMRWIDTIELPAKRSAENGTDQTVKTEEVLDQGVQESCQEAGTVCGLLSGVRSGSQRRSADVGKAGGTRSRRASKKAGGTASTVHARIGRSTRKQVAPN